MHFQKSEVDFLGGINHLQVISVYYDTAMCGCKLFQMYSWIQWDPLGKWHMPIKYLKKITYGPTTVLGYQTTVWW